ncbi:MAG: hypothetical protein E7K17_14470, partial [Klebsiella michiganensis]|nr:hypothetical protein [Klebsiella michiganensis]
RSFFTLHCNCSAILPQLYRHEFVLWFRIGLEIAVFELPHIQSARGFGGKMLKNRRCRRAGQGNAPNAALRG